jgi:hypothetical protein
VFYLFARCIQRQTLLLIKENETRILRIICSVLRKGRQPSFRDVWRSSCRTICSPFVIAHGPG